MRFLLKIVGYQTSPESNRRSIKPYGQFVNIIDLPHLCREGIRDREHKVELFQTQIDY
jgi:hypothetical protein